MTKGSKQKRAIEAPLGRSEFLSADERAGKGRTLRDVVPRATHAGWKAPMAGAIR